MHKKLNSMPKKWPVPRKGRKFIALAEDKSADSVPLLFVIRDILKIANTRREVRKITLSGQVTVNGKVRKGDSYPIRERDILEIGGKNYVLKLEGKKIRVKEEKIDQKISKIVGKTTVSGGKFQANLDDGRNILLKEKFSCGDSLLSSFGKEKTNKVIPLKKGSNVEIIGGKNVSKKGKVVELKKEGKRNVFEVNIDGGESTFLRGDVLLAIE